LIVLKYARFIHLAHFSETEHLYALGIIDLQKLLPSKRSANGRKMLPEKLRVSKIIECCQQLHYLESTEERIQDGVP
jgi:hypothetical protein